MKQYQNSLKMFNEVLQIEPTNVKALYWRGLSNKLLGNIQESKEDLMTAHKLDEKNIDIINELKKVNILLKDQFEQEKKIWGQMFLESKKLNNQQKIQLEQNKENPIVLMQISYLEQMYELEIELFIDQLPITCENFINLIPKYKNTIFFRNIKGFVIQGGDYINNNGTGGNSYYGKDFEDENFIFPNIRGSIAMANSGPDTNRSQFYINYTKNYHLNNKNVVFGMIRKNIEFLNILEYAETGPGDRPIDQITIQNMSINK